MDRPVDPIRGHNLSEPAPGDHGAHGGFDGDNTTSARLRLNMNLPWVALAGY
jgi:hypothetical protein